jgi:hypothetical protein
LSSLIIAGNTSGTITLDAPNVAGTTTLTLPTTSGTIVTTNTMPAGSVLQVVNSTATSGVISTTSTSFVTTNFSLSITPTSSSNKVIAIFSFNGQVFGTGAAEGYATIYRGATNILNTNGTILYNNNATNIHIPTVLTITDSPSTTSATTYTLYFRVQGSNTFNLNAANGAITITLMEIKG